MKTDARSRFSKVAQDSWQTRACVDVMIPVNNLTTKAVKIVHVFNLRSLDSRVGLARAAAVGIRVDLCHHGGDVAHLGTQPRDSKVSLQVLRYREDAKRFEWLSIDVPTGTLGAGSMPI